MPRGRNYVIIQFRLQRQSGKGADRETDPATTYQANLTRFLDETRAAGAMPIRDLDRPAQSGRRRPIQPDANMPYVEEVRRLGAARHVPVMDLYALTLGQCERLGRAGCEALGARTAAGALDTTHLGPVGQREVGALAAAEFLRVVLPGQPPADPKSIAAAALLPLNRARTTFPMPVPRDPRLPSLVIIGDSTVRNGQGDGAGGLWGWGDALSDYFDTSKINIVNRAISGLSSRTYLTLGHWDRALALLKAGDVLLVQFGHNDAGPINSPTRARGSLPGTGDDVATIDNQMTGEREDVHTYGWYLRRVVGDARSKGASVIVCSPVPRNAWKDGRVVQNDDYRNWAAAVARANGAAFVDLNALGRPRTSRLGPRPFGRSSPVTTPTSRAGAESPRRP